MILIDQRPEIMGHTPRLSISVDKDVRILSHCQ